jgi:hypothetical protein
VQTVGLKGASNIHTNDHWYNPALPQLPFSRERNFL